MELRLLHLLGLYGLGGELVEIWISKRLFQFGYVSWRNRFIFFLSYCRWLVLGSCWSCWCWWSFFFFLLWVWLLLFNRFCLFLFFLLLWLWLLCLLLWSLCVLGTHLSCGWSCCWGCCWRCLWSCCWRWCWSRSFCCRSSWFFFGGFLFSWLLSNRSCWFCCCLSWHWSWSVGGVISSEILNIENSNSLWF